MLKILFFNSFNGENIFIIFGFQIFNFTIGIGASDGKYQDTCCLGLVCGKNLE